MTSYVPRIISVNPLIGEAKRRMKLRRSLMAIFILALAGGAVATLALRGSSAGAAAATLALRDPSALKRMTCLPAPGPRRSVGVPLTSGSLVRLPRGLYVEVMSGHTCGAQFWQQNPGSH